MPANRKIIVNETVYRHLLQMFVAAMPKLTAECAQTFRVVSVSEA